VHCRWGLSQEEHKDLWQLNSQNLAKTSSSKIPQLVGFGMESHGSHLESHDGMTEEKLYQKLFK
jgi:hypothetical protein